MKTSRVKNGILLYLALLVVLHIGILWQLRDFVFQGYNDFAAFYTAGKLVQEGHASGIYNPHLQWQAQQKFAPGVNIRQGPLPYIRPPFEALLFLPFALFKYPTAYLLWTSLKILLLCAVPFLLPQPVDRRLFPASLEGPLLLGFFPIGLDLLQGQDSILMLFVLTIALRFLHQKAEFRSGCALALGLFKFHLVIPIALVFLLRRKSRLISGFLVTALMLIGVSAAVVGWDGILAYPKYVWNLDQALGMGVTTSYNMPNLRALVTALLGDKGLPGSVNVLLLIVAGMGIITAAWLWGPATGDDDRSRSVGVSLSIVLTILTSYYAYSYDLTLLLVPILLLQDCILNEGTLRGWSRILFAGGVALLTFSPLYWFLIFRTRQLCWAACLVLMMLAISLAWARKTEMVRL